MVTQDRDNDGSDSPLTAAGAGSVRVDAESSVVRERILFEAARQRPPAERARFLAEASSADPALAERVLRLLAFAEESGHPLDPPAALLAAELGGAAPERIGSYRVLEEIGRGGMGIVYLAERDDGSFHQRVAIKLIRSALQSDVLTQRFLAERQILATLQHANIARLLDGGVASDGRPYLVMELVAGEPIDLYCDRQQLGIDERVRLFATVCRAVQHAHRNLIVHRDLKPSNILVTADREVRLLDFGIAKILSEPGTDARTAVETQAGLRLMTPQYASPEQVLLGPITHATDIYSLGVLLFELLSGEPPYDVVNRSAADIERIVGQEAAARMSTTFERRLKSADGAETAARTARVRGSTPARLQRRLSGDLDRIVETALRKEPERRYASAELLADDLLRFLEGRPVAARGLSRGYRTRRFVLRHRWSAGALALGVTALAGFAVTRAIEQGNLRSARANAQVEAGRVLDDERLAEQLTASVVSMLEQAGALASESDTTVVRGYVERSMASVQIAGNEAPEQARLFDIAGDVYQRLAKYDQARISFDRALGIRASQFGRTHLEVATSYDRLAGLAQAQGRLHQADSLHSIALELKRRLAGDDNLGVAANYLGRSFATVPNLTAAEGYARESLRIRERLLGPTHPLVADVLMHLSTLRRWQGEHADAEALIRRAIAIRTRALGPDHPRTVESTFHLADQLYTQDGPTAAAEEMYRTGLATLRRTGVTDWRTNIWVLQALGRLQVDRGQYAEAEALFRESLRIVERAIGPNHPGVSGSLQHLARALSGQERYREAEAVQRRALSLLEAQFGPDNVIVWRGLHRLAGLLADQGRAADAETLVKEWLAALLARGGAESAAAGTGQRTLAQLAARQQRLAEAERLYIDAIRILRQHFEDRDEVVRDVRVELARLRDTSGRL